MGEIRDAVNNYNTAINLDPKFGEAYLHRGALNLYLKKKSAACNDLEMASKLNVQGASEAFRKNCK
jgi:hypothetical protein